MIQYVRDPERILQLGFDRIREQVALDSFTADQQQVVLADLEHQRRLRPLDALLHLMQDSLRLALRNR